MDNFIPNSFQVPNALVDEIIATLSPNALKCYLVVIRKTVGWQKEWDKIATTQLMELTGIKRKDTIYKSMQELENLELIESSKELGRLTSYRLVLKNRTSTDKPSQTSTKKPYSTKDNNKTQNEYDIFLEYLKKNCKYKTKITSTKDGKKLFNSIENKKLLIIHYLAHQNEKKEYSQRITAFMEDYETVHKNSNANEDKKLVQVNGKSYEEVIL